MASLKTLRLKKLENLNAIKEIVEGRTYYVESNNTLYRDVLSTRMAVGQVYFVPGGISERGDDKTLTLSNVLVISNEVINQEDVDENGADAQRSYVVGMYDENGEYIDLSTGFSVGVHIHKINDVTGLQAVLDRKAAKDHTHEIYDVTGLQGELEGLQSALDGKAEKSHEHLFTEITGVAEVDQIPKLPFNKLTITQENLTGTINLGETQVIQGINSSLGELQEDITALEGELDGKAPLSHGHEIDDVTGLQGALDGKAPLSHGHTIGQVTGLQGALDGKAPLSHGHTIGQVTGLQGALDSLQTDIGKAVLTTTDQDVAGEKTFKNITTFEKGVIIPGQNSYIDIGRKDNWFWTRFSGENWTFNNTYTGGGWARNLLEMKDAEGTAYFRIGAQGSSQNFTQMYIGPAYNNYWLSLNDDRALFRAKPQYASDPTTNNDLTRKYYVDTQLATKQATLVNENNIKSFNGQTLLGPGAFKIATNKVLGRTSSDSGEVEQIDLINIDDLGLAKDTDIPTKVSDLANDEGYTTNKGTVTNVSAGTTQVSGLSLLVNNGTSTPTITTSISNAANFRAAIGAGTSNLTIGTTATTAKAGNYQPTWSQVTEKPSFATVATSGSYNDLSNKPSIPAAQVQSNWNATSGMGVILNKPNLSTVATSGSYNDLSNKPSIPTIPSVMTTTEGNAGTATTQRTINAKNLKDIILNHSPAGARPSSWSQVSGKPSFATVATSGSYNDLSNKPTIPAAQVQSNWNATSGMGVILNKPNLSTVATSGSYNDLSNKPSIPTIPSILSIADGKTGTATTQRTISAKNLKEIILHHAAESTHTHTYENITGLETNKVLGRNTSGTGEVEAIETVNINQIKVSDLEDGTSYVTTTEINSMFDTLETSKQDKLVAGENITIDPTTNVISASSGGGGEVDLNEMAYFDYASSIYGDKYSLLVNAWEHSLTVDPSEISADNRGKAQYPNGATEGIIIPQGVTSIGDKAFYYWASNNQPLVIPNSVTSIGSQAFHHWTANNQPLVIPNSVTSIGSYAFYYWTSNNQPLTIPNSVTSIGPYAFNDWEANSHPLVIPESVTSIGSQAFYNWRLVPYVEIKRATPPTLVSNTAFGSQNDAPIYVPDESVNAYKTATNWVNLADRIFPISDKVGVQADWNETNSNSYAFIKNKPSFAKWTEIWSGAVNLNAYISSFYTVSVPTNTYISKRIAIEVQYSTGTTYTSKIIFGVLGSNPVYTASTSVSKGIGWNYFDGTYLRIKTLFAYTPTGTGSSIYVGHLKSLLGTFTGNTIEWTTSHRETLYMRKIWVIE